MNIVLEKLEQIMKLYYDKKKEMDTLEQLEQKEKVKSNISEREENRKKLEVELENLRVKHIVDIKEFEDRKQKEIDEYIEKTLNPNFYVSYGSVLRKDLEQTYNKRLEEIENEYSKKESALIEELSKLEQSIPVKETYKFRNVDLIEMFQIKTEIRKKLEEELEKYKNQFDNRIKLNEELSNLQQELVIKNNELSNFKYEYNDQKQLINGDAWRKTYEESRKISSRIEEINDILLQKKESENIKVVLSKIEEYIKLTELTSEEISAVMINMTPLEKEEYNKRKTIETNIVKDDDSLKNEQNDKIILKDKANLFKYIYEDIVKEAKNLKTVKINSNNTEYIVNESVDLTKLPCGEYFNVDDILIAVDDLYNKTKGRAFVVKESGKEYKISKTTLEIVKTNLKKNIRKRLINEKKVSKLDLLRAFGKEKSDKIVKEIETKPIKKEIVLEGEYISKDDLLVSLDKLFTTKNLEWLNNIKDKIQDEEYDLTDNKINRR